MSFSTLISSHIEKMDRRRAELGVPDFAMGLTWFNSSPLSFAKDLKGKIVVLDFWTYCCINCMHVLPDLAALEKKYAKDPVVFIGVHSAKFENEKDDHNLRHAILRYAVEHPIVNDPHMTLWQQLGVRSWPTLIVVGPFGNLLYAASGEGHRENLDAVITASLKYYHLSLNPDPLSYHLEKNFVSNTTPFLFPAKLATSKDSLFISDSNHHRIVVTSFDGKIKEIIGSGKPGFKDGSLHEAQFNRLQGLAYFKDHLYVADSENHAVRDIDLQKKTVTTLIGNGIQGHDYKGGSSGQSQQLSTPWDIVINNNGTHLYIAMAGTHQIWLYDFKTGRARNWSGSGAEQNLNSTRLLEAAWSQPSGITIGNHCLYVADSESSSIRMIDLQDEHTATLVGGDDANPANLFSFGDLDGKGMRALLQHPLGVIWWEEKQSIIVADTYNHRLKILDPQTRYIRSWIGSGRAGYKDGQGLEAQFAEPSGFAWHPNQQILFVADTNNHAIRAVDTSKALVETFNVS